jgi:hypothetical protein
MIANEMTRRVFLIRSAGTAGTLLVLADEAPAASHVDEGDEGAASLGYRHDASTVDRQRFPKYAPPQHCATCSFFQGADGDAWGGCAMFGRHQVAAAGWCNAWAARPAPG